MYIHVHSAEQDPDWSWSKLICYCIYKYIRYEALYTFLNLSVKKLLNNVIQMDKINWISIECMYSLTKMFNLMFFLQWQPQHSELLNFFCNRWKRSGMHLIAILQNLFDQCFGIQNSLCVSIVISKQLPGF